MARDPGTGDRDPALKLRPQRAGKSRRIMPGPLFAARETRFYK
tara:strand:+ start:180 stop:308 length:129 start_codon:yes stop_codon:yes gene_type:complete